MAAGNRPTRSFGGCSTCRTRRMRCDENRPTCNMCDRSGLQCGGYEKAIFFDVDGHREDGVGRFRRQLFTEMERQTMCHWLVSSVQPQSELQLLSQIDEECANISARHFQIIYGPFGAFKLGEDLTTSPCTPSSEDATNASHGHDHDLVQDSTDCFGLAADTPSPRTRELIQFFNNQEDLIMLPSTPDFWDSMNYPARVEEIFEIAPEDNNPGITILPAAMPSIRTPRPLSPGVGSLLIDNSNPITQTAVLLLKHYTDNVINLLTPVSHNKTPWHILVVPHIRHCLGALVLQESLDDASLVTFYGTLAISALSLGGICQSQMWLEQAKLYKQCAREHARRMLKTAYIDPKISKYKTTLLALLTVIQVSVFSGNRDETECYFLEAERFIRIRGMNRRKSRKVRLLHHCYTFERLFHESTFVGGLNSSQRSHHMKAVTASGCLVHNVDSPAFRLPTWNNLEQEMLEVKDQRIGENDLHLERPGIWSRTMYPEIFAVPEKWILCLSLVIRLGKEKESSAQNDAEDPLSLRDFTNRARAVEKCITEMELCQQIPSKEAEYQLQHAPGLLSLMYDAMQTALLIYFYRRIYDLNSAMLQPKVVRVRDCLLRCEQLDPNTLHGSATFVWSASIAAFEAEDPEVQHSFSTWFKNSARRSGLHSFNMILQSIEQVWQEKRSSSSSNVTWFDTLRKNFWLT